MIGHSKPTMTDTIRNALREAKAEARSAQRFGERITFQYVVTDPVIVDYHHACIHADYDLSAAVLAGHTYTIGKTMLVGRFENTKKKVALFRTAKTLDFQLRDEMASKSVKGMVGQLHALVSFGHAFALICVFSLDIFGSKCRREKG